MSNLKHSLTEIMKRAHSGMDKYVIILRAWNKIAGQSVRKASYPSFMRNNTLYLTVIDNVWMNELSLMKHELKKKITKETGITLDDIRMQIGEVKNEENVGHKKEVDGVLTDEERDWIEATIEQSGITDGELKIKFRKTLLSFRLSKREE